MDKHHDKDEQMGMDRRLRDLFFMRETAWRGIGDVELVAVLESLYVGDGESSPTDATRLLTDRLEEELRDITSRCAEDVMAVDALFRDCLLPIDEHLATWRASSDELSWLLEDLANRLVIYGAAMGEEVPHGLPVQVKDGISPVADASQRLLAYRLVLEVLDRDWNTADKTMGLIVNACMLNLDALLRGDNPGDCYLSWCVSAGGWPVCGAEYWCEPLVVASGILEHLGHGGEAAKTVDGIVRWLEAQNGLTEDAERVREDIVGRLDGLANGLRTPDNGSPNHEEGDR